ncbi:MAG: hypothetical protein MUE52_10275 [Tabrizicola sp.]|nr:hypothetical protein [Tabrizicola sp.]
MPVTIHAPQPSDLTAAEIARWAKVPVAVAVDVGNAKGQIDPAIRPLRPAGQQPRLFGPAVTVRCEPPDFGAVLHALDIIQPGQVLVIDADGHRDTAMIGDILSGHLRAKGVAGIVCDGAVRDTGTLGQWDDFPVFSRVNCRVTIGGVSVTPRDLIIGDDDGLICLKPAMVRELIADAEAKLQREEQWIKALAAGKSAADVFGLAPAVRL